VYSKFAHIKLSNNKQKKKKKKAAAAATAIGNFILI